MPLEERVHIGTVHDAAIQARLKDQRSQGRVRLSVLLDQDPGVPEFVSGDGTQIAI